MWPLLVGSSLCVACMQACFDVIWQCKKAGIDTADDLSPVHCVLSVGEVTRVWALCPPILYYPCS